MVNLLITLLLFRLQTKLARCVTVLPAILNAKLEVPVQFPLKDPCIPFTRRIPRVAPTLVAWDPALALVDPRLRAGRVICIIPRRPTGKEPEPSVKWKADNWRSSRPRGSKAESLAGNALLLRGWISMLSNEVDRLHVSPLCSVDYPFIFPILLGLAS